MSGAPAPTEFQPEPDDLKVAASRAPRGIVGKGRYNYIDLWIKALTALIGLITVGVGVGNFVSTLQRDARSRELEARRPVIELKRKLYGEAATTIADLANLKPGSPDWRSAQRRFWQLYYGELPPLESEAVRQQMVAAGNVLLNVSEENPIVSNEDTVLLNRAAVTLAEEGGTELRRYYMLVLGEDPDRPRRRER